MPPPFSPSAPCRQTYIIYQHNYPLHHFLLAFLATIVDSVTASMDDSSDTWELVAHSGNYTWSDYPGSNDDSVFHKAAFSGDIARLGLSIAALDDLDIPNEYRQSPLHLAVQGNQAEATRILLSAGANPWRDCVIDDNGPPPLSVVESAAYHGCNDALIAVADHGVKLSVNALYWAALQGHVQCVLTMLERLSPDALHDERNQFSAGHALQAAAANHHLRIVEILLSHVSEDPDATHAIDKDVLTLAMLNLLTDQNMFDGCTKISSSDRSLTLPILKLLVSAGAEVDGRAFWSIHCSCADIVLYLLDHGLQVDDTRYWNHFNCCEPYEEEVEDEWEPMILRVVRHTNDDTVVLAAFLAAGASVAARDKDGNTPLHLAASVPASKLLLQHGADPQSLNAAGQSPLYTACLHNHLDVARLLLSRGADVWSIAQDQCWLSLMSDASPHIWWWSIDWNTDTENYRFELAEFLLLYGANVQAANEDGLTALHMAALRGHIKLMSVLLAHGGDITAVTKKGQTVLHIACACSTGPGSGKQPRRDGMSVAEDTIRFLLDQGTDVNVKDDYGVTPLIGLLRWVLDATNGDTKTFNILLARGADLDAKADGDDRTIRSYIDQSEGWRINEIGLLEAVPAKPAHAHSDPSMRGRGRGRGRGWGRGHHSTWT
jgi:ankyrin repeat protein